MKFFLLDKSGYFYANGSVVKIAKKPKGVVRYIIHKDAVRPIIVTEKRRFFDMQEAELLEVVTDKLERIYFEYVDGEFRQKYYETVEILEGEDEFRKHLNLENQPRVARRRRYF